MKEAQGFVSNIPGINELGKLVVLSKHLFRTYFGEVFARASYGDGAA